MTVQVHCNPATPPDPANASKMHGPPASRTHVFVVRPGFEVTLSAILKLSHAGELEQEFRDTTRVISRPVVVAAAVAHGDHTIRSTI